MAKLDKNHLARSPYEPGQQVDKPEKDPGRGVGGKQGEAAPPKKKAAKKKAAK